MGINTTFERKVWTLNKTIYEDGAIFDSDCIGVFSRCELATYNMVQYAVKNAKGAQIIASSENVLVYSNGNKTCKLWIGSMAMDTIDEYFSDGIDGIGE